MSDPIPSKPYFLRAVYEWCVDNGYTPHISVVVDANTRVPMEHVRDGEIVLNIGPLATSKLRMGNDTIECTARFSGAARDLSIPVAAVAAIFARENGQGMSFETDPAQAPGEGSGVAALRKPGESPEPPKPSGRKPALRRVK